ncbi:MAG: polysaccharide deacetylase [Ferruginibacter sp.]|uniref:polysaccharide deacetylase family protein n=1 Tax=Ferruginibacter sp. TaxID=1940288 RepID=UPI0026593343|nr:polysaccharide deacetylase family protein [Ferruginibacter sp.]MDB5276042.1 polysaccharide deacetylase [Ferruginibacter sp.]
MFYFVKTPVWLKKIYSGCTWQMNTVEKKIYLSFDDGPHPVATKFVLQVLEKYNARATFFCIGKNVAAYPEVYQQILAGGHAVGNHTFNHLNGWKTPVGMYIENIEQAQQLIKTNLFRPPYGKISFKQLKALSVKQPTLKVIMWSVLSADFDRKITPEKCCRNVLENTGNGSIVVFHDSEKAFENLQFALPKMVQHFSRLGYNFEKIDCVN